MDTYVWVLTNTRLVVEIGGRGGTCYGRSELDGTISFVINFQASNELYDEGVILGDILHVW